MLDFYLTESEAREIASLNSGARCDDCARVVLRGWDSYVAGTPANLGVCRRVAGLSWCDLHGITCEEFASSYTGC